MTPEEMKTYFQHRELGVQGAAGEYAILVPLVEREGTLCLLFETRASTLVGHQPSEVCFPGGRREPGEKPVETALRETWEEIGIPAEEIEILAPLDVMQDISDRVVYPFLGKISPKGVAEMAVSRAEVADVFFVPLEVLMDYEEEVYRYRVSAQVDDGFPYERIGFPRTYPWRTGWMDVPIYQYEGHTIWGMTGRMVRWLVKELRTMQEGNEEG
ncbi:CoA pyrophosphatase [Evtepia sp.]|uniref:NUDIX hydrolase n=1 Tax=Evtepia sp. TaxID=2773933 RepID=UPI002A75B6B4|nr:CoA pyrophosphatase [Evtepia sp.]